MLADGSFCRCFQRFSKAENEIDNRFGGRLGFMSEKNPPTYMRNLAGRICGFIALCQHSASLSMQLSDDLHD